jgi:bifunctional UDP-N-acetylglucosamine pyrophosphorylase/glucosamine-1-phosphate N-acetyltransferase
VVEERDATPAQQQIREINSGIYIAQAVPLFQLLSQVRPHNAQGEYYLTDIVGLAVKKGLRLSAVAARDPDEVLGINTRADLARADKIIRKRTVAKLMAQGVTVMDPENTYIDATVAVGRDTVIYPGTFIEGSTRIGENCVITQSVLEDGVMVGPFAHLRPGSVLRRTVKVGNFVEIKKSEIGEGSKANHLTYLGDARVGRGVNIGAGSVTCNYDGEKKSETVIGDHVFVGSDTQFVAPVKIGSGAITAAGSVITEDVPPDSLAIGRARQVNKKGWAGRKKARRR